MEPDPRVEFSLPARAENVPLVRHALAGVAEALEMDASEIADLKTVVTEACMNAVVHAYAEAEPGPLDVAAWTEDERIVIRVRDYGRGIRPLADIERRSLRLGLPLIAALTDSFEVRGRPGEGTEVTMRMRLSVDGDRPWGSPPAHVEETRVSVNAGDLLSPVLSRVISMFAARAEFSVDKLSDVVLLSDAISAHGPDRFPEGTARLAVREQEGAVEIRLGPLDDGGGERLIAGMRIPILDASLERLADEMRVVHEQGAEHLLIRISQPKA